MNGCVAGLSCPCFRRLAMEPLPGQYLPVSTAEAGDSHTAISSMCTACTSASTLEYSGRFCGLICAQDRLNFH